MGDVLERVESVCGKLTAKRVASLADSRDKHWLEGLWQELRALADEDIAAALPPLRSDDAGPQPRPYFPLSPVQRDRASRLTLGKYAFADWTQIEAGMATLARDLLYCGSVAIDEPMFWLTSDMIGELDAYGRGRLHDREPQIINGLRFLAYTRPLIEAQRLVLVPYVHSVFKELAINPRSALREISDDDLESISDEDFSDYLEHFGLRRDEWAFSSDDPEGKRIMLAKAIWEMEPQVRTTAYFDGRVDFSTDANLHQSALRWLVGRAPGAPEAERLRALARLPGLRFEDDWKTLIDLARGEDSFARWRTDMGRALQTISALDSTRADFAERARTAFQDEMFDAVVDLRSKGRQASWRGILTPGVEDVAFGMVGMGAVVGASVILGVAVTGIGAVAVGGAAVSRALFTFARGRGARRQAQAVGTLYDALRAGPASS